jgi:hypothetical protein
MTVTRVVTTLTEGKIAALAALISQNKQQQADRDGCQLLSVASCTSFSRNAKHYIQIKVRTSAEEKTQMITSAEQHHATPLDYRRNKLLHSVPAPKASQPSS